MKIQQEYRQTAIERIPKEWEVVRLGDGNIADLIMGQSPPSSTYNTKGDGFPFLQGNAEFGETYPTPVLSCNQPIKIAEKNDILLSVRAPVGAVNISPFRSCIGRGLAAIRPKVGHLDRLFLFYYLKVESKTFESLSMGSTFKAIRKREIETFQLPLPPLPEQKKIAEILSTVDDAIQKVDQAIEKTQRLKQGLMRELLTRGIEHQEFKETEIGRIPNVWEVAKIGKIGNLQYGYTASALEKETGVKLLRITDIEDNGQVNWGKVPYCEIDKNGFEKYKLFVGDVVFVRIGATTGKTAFVDTEIQGVFASYLIRFKPLSENVSTEFFRYYTQSNIYWKQVHKYKEGQLKKGLNAKILSNLILPLPPLPEQEKIAEILSTVDERLERLNQKREKLVRVKKGLMHDLLTGRKRVKIEA